jgi:Ankyrin repeats (3 copies)
MIEKANAHCTSPATKVSPLTESAKRGRSDLIKDLVQLGAKVSFRDGQEHSALYYLCKLGDLKTASFLLDHGARRSGDASLHAAAEYCHENLIAMLIQAGYDPDDIIEGKTALAQLCLEYQPHGPDWEEMVRESIKILLDSGSDPMRKLISQSGKTVLHLSFENSTCSVQILKALLECPEISKRVDDVKFRFKDSNGLLYSPTKYLELCCHDIPLSMKQKLIKLLHDKNCVDRYYNPAGLQPQGCCGLPDELEEENLRQRRRDAEFEEEIRRKKRMQHLTMTHADEMETTEQDREERKHALAQRRSKQRHDQDIRQDREKNQLQLDQARAFSEVKLREQQESVNQQRQLLEYQDNAGTRAAKREREQIQFRTDHVKIQAKEMKAVAAAATSANVPPRLLTQGMSTLSLPSPD